MDGTNECSDLSVNWCPRNLEEETELLLVTCFKLGDPTPGAMNDCSATSYILEEHLEEILPTCENSVTATAVDIPQVCSLSTDVTRKAQISSKDVTTHRDIVMNIKQRQFLKFKKSNAMKASKPLTVSYWMTLKIQQL